jgi:uncharacterized protein YndB with AHSA1/START domain
MNVSYQHNRGIDLTRMFDAPPEMVFQAWTDPRHLGWFFNPSMSTDIPVTVDLRVGGQWRQHMVVNEETQYMTGGVYREIEPNRKLVFSWGAVDGWPKINADSPDDGPLATIILTPVGEGTRMDFTLRFPDQMSEDAFQDWMKMPIEAGWGMTIDRMYGEFERV